MLRPFAMAGAAASALAVYLPFYGGASDRPLDGRPASETELAANSQMS
jgi:hypothetical protein